MDVMHIVSVNTGPIALLGFRGPRRVRIESGIRKSPVKTDQTLILDVVGLEGDTQADPRVHGAGHGKAVYAYPHAHYRRWAEQGLRLSPGGFGENLTVAGANGAPITEDMVVIGEQWRWGPAVLEVTKPRTPCFKLDMLHGDGTGDAMRENGRCGWYFKVVTPGVVPTRGELHLVNRPLRGQTVADAFGEKAQRTGVHQLVETE